MPDCFMPPATSPSYIGPHIYASDQIGVHGRGSDVLQTVQTASANCFALSWKLNSAKQHTRLLHSRWQKNVLKSSTTPGCCSVPRAPQCTDRASAVERPWPVDTTSAGIAVSIQPHMTTLNRKACSSRCCPDGPPPSMPPAPRNQRLSSGTTRLEEPLQLAPVFAMLSTSCPALATAPEEMPGPEALSAHDAQCELLCIRSGAAARRP